MRSYFVSLIAGCLVAAVGASEEAAQLKADETPSAMLRIEGQVVDASGGPVEGASVSFVWSALRKQEKPPLPTAATDRDGRFSLEIARELVDFRRTATPALLAVDKAQRLGWQSGDAWTLVFRVGGRELPELVTLERPIKLLEVRDCTGIVLDAAGQPVAGATVRPTWFSESSFGAVRQEGRDGGDYLNLSSELQNQWTARTDATGRFRIASLPARGTIRATLETQDNGSAHLTWSLDSDAQLQLLPVGALRGRLETAADEAAIRSVRVYIRREKDAATDAKSFVIHFYETVTPKDDGSFAIAKLPQGRYVLTVSLDGRYDWYAEGPATIDAATVADAPPLTLNLLRAREIRGRVVDSQDGHGVADTQVMVSERRTESEPARPGGFFVTDKDGYYTAFARPGQATLLVPRPPKGLMLPWESLIVSIAASDENQIISAPDIKLNRTAELEVLVVNQHGQPQPQAEIRILTPYRAGAASEAQSFRADQFGRFVLEGLDPADTLPIWARTKDAVSDGELVVDTANIDGAVTISVTPEYAFRLKGIVQDQLGRAIPQATVAIGWQCKFASRRNLGTSMTPTLATKQTDSDGTFAAAPLWPKHSYRLRITAEGYGPSETSLVAGAAGKTHDFGVIKLTSIQGVVAGRVVDAGGNAVSDALVFNSGDAPVRLETRSDTNGRFQLEGFREGSVAIFAEKARYRFTALRTHAGASDVVIELLPVEAGAAEPIAEPGLTADERHNLARWMIERLRRVRGSGGTIDFAMLRSLAGIDPDAALAWVDEAGYQSRRDDVLLSIAEARVSEDADEALALISQVSAARWFSRVHKIARRAVEISPDAARRHAEDWIFRLRQLEQPHQVYSVAQLGRLLIDLGQVEAGKRLLDEARETAERLGGSGLEGFARGYTAAQLAPFDIDAALKLIEPITDSREKIRYTANVAVEISRHDPDRAIAMAPTMASGHLWMRMALKMADDDLPKAKEVLAQMRGSGDERYRALGLAWVARAVHRRHPEEAFRLIDESLAITIQLPVGFDTWSNYGREAPIAAYTAVVAQEIGYADMQSVVARVLACRRPDSRMHSDVDRLKSVVTMAKILAVVDRQAARWLLEAIRDRDELFGGGGYDSIDRNDWLLAWSLVDSQFAQRLVEEEIRRQVIGPWGKLKVGTLTRAVEMLSAPKYEFMRVLTENDAIWFPGDPE